MKFIPVDDIPMRRSKHDLRQFIEDFIESDAKIVKVIFSDQDYKSSRVCRSCLGVAVTKSGYNIKAVIRGEEVFLKKL